MERTFLPQSQTLTQILVFFVMKVSTILVLLAVVIAGCTTSTKTDNMQATNVDSTGTGPVLQAIELSNQQGVRVGVTNFGARVISLWTPNQFGKQDNIILGYDSLEQYLTGNPYFGAAIGRYGNRIAGGTFELDGKAYQLAKNNGENALHGGPGGFHNVYWDMRKKEDVNAVEFNYHSKDGEEGYPGNLEVKMTYTLTDQNELIIDYQATTDQPTVINLTHHSFFNLAGEGSGDVLGHELMINADRFTPVNDQLIPTGEMKPVRGTPFDFTKPHLIGERIDGKDQQLTYGRGYDHNWVLNRTGDGLSLAAQVREPNTGRTLEVWTTEPGLQFYSGNFLDGSDKGFGGKAYEFRGAFCLEAQHFPDSPNHANFPTTLLRPGEVYSQQTVYKFGVDKAN